MPIGSPTTDGGTPADDAEAVVQNICRAILALNLPAGVTLCKRLPPACKGVESYLKLALFAANMVVTNNANTPFYFFDDASWDALNELAPASTSAASPRLLDASSAVRLLERYLQERPRGTSMPGAD